MPDDINELDVTDAGLKAIMGNRFHDETQSEPQKAISKKETTHTNLAEKSAQRAKDKPVNAQWEPVKPDPNWMDKLKNCAVLTAPFSCLTMLVFYWNEAGLMADSIAIPSMLFCACVAGLGIGRVVSK